MSVVMRVHPFTEKVSDMSDDDEDDIREVGREQDVIGWILVKVRFEGCARRVLGRESVPFVGAMSKFEVARRKCLRRVWRHGGDRQLLVDDHIRFVELVARGIVWGRRSRWDARVGRRARVQRQR